MKKHLGSGASFRRPYLNTVSTPFASVLPASTGGRGGGADAYPALLTARDDGDAARVPGDGTST